MEDARIKVLRNRYGIGDSRNEYTEEEIMDIINTKAYYFSYYINDILGEVDFVQKEVSAYLSKDRHIWLKDENLTEGHLCYMPMVTERTGKKLEDGIYKHNNSYGYETYYCFDKNLEYCLALVRRDLASDLKERIDEHQRTTSNLKKELDKLFF